MSFIDELRLKLSDALQLELVEINDFSAQHKDHDGAHADGESHLHAVIVSHAFEGSSRLVRHKMVHAILRRELESGRLHALSLVTLTPKEYQLGIQRKAPRQQ